jgi:hypothetical protein
MQVPAIPSSGPAAESEQAGWQALRALGVFRCHQPLGKVVAKLRDFAGTWVIRSPRRRDAPPEQAHVAVARPLLLRRRLLGTGNAWSSQTVMRRSEGFSETRVGLSDVTAHWLRAHDLPSNRAAEARLTYSPARPGWPHYHTRSRRKRRSLQARTARSPGPLRSVRNAAASPGEMTGALSAQQLALRSAERRSPRLRFYLREDLAPRLRLAPAGKEPALVPPHGGGGTSVNRLGIQQRSCTGVTDGPLRLGQRLRDLTVSPTPVPCLLHPLLRKRQSDRCMVAANSAAR